MRIRQREPGDEPADDDAHGDPDVARVPAGLWDRSRRRELGAAIRTAQRVAENLGVPADSGLDF